MPDNITSTLFLGAIGGPVAAFVGSQLKDLLELRDARKKAERLTAEASALLAFSDTLQKSAAAGGAVTAVPSESLARLQQAVTDRIAEAIAAVSAYPAPPENAFTRTVLDRVFLLHRPMVWWAWVIHGTYYICAGMLVLVTGFVISDYMMKASDRGAGLAIAIFLGIITIFLNVWGNYVDKHHVAKAQTGKPS